MTMQGSILAICVSAERGQPKQQVAEARLQAGHGIEGDAHAGNWHRQVSLLAEEQIDLMRQQGIELVPGAFGENIVTKGFPLEELVPGRRFRAGERAVLQVTQRGKECHTRCRIYDRIGDCVMPREGVFTRVRRGGPLRPGDILSTDPELEKLRYAVVTLSDRASAGEREDASGAVVAEMLGRTVSGNLVVRRLLPDDQKQIEAELIRLCDEELCDLVVTTGGTGLSPRDVTPEATLAIVDRQVPGMAEAMRAAGLRITPRAMLSRGVCGQRGASLIINLSGSPRAAAEQLEVLLPALPHALETASGIPQDCGRQPRE